MTKKNEGTVVLLGNLGARESGSNQILSFILATRCSAVGGGGTRWAIMSHARTQAGDDLGGSSNRRTIATPRRGVFFLSGGCSTFMAKLRPYSVRGAVDGNPSGLMFPIDIPPTRRRRPHHLGGWCGNQATKSNRSQAMSATKSIRGQVVSVALIPSIESITKGKPLESERDCYEAIYGTDLGAARRTVSRLNDALGVVADAMVKTDADDGAGAMIDAFVVLSFLCDLIRADKGVSHE